MYRRLKRDINRAMLSIAKRKRGRKKLVYDRTRKTIISIDRQGHTEDTGLSISDDDANMIA